MRKYVFSFLRYFIFYFLGFIAFFLFDYVLTALNEYLAGYIPELFKSFNPITNREQLMRQEKIIAALATVISIFFISNLSVRTDNLKYEYMISKTEGFYRIKDGAKIYFAEFFRADILAAVCAPTLTYALALIKIPNDASKTLKVLGNLLEIPASMPSSFAELFGFALGAVMIISVSVAARIPAIYFSLVHWRASWLTGAERQG